MPFHFLELSAELRNIIYEFAANEDASSPIPIRRVKNAVSGTYAGLTRVNRQIRKEYRPIQRRSASVQVWPNDVMPFLQTFRQHEKNKKVTPVKTLYIKLGTYGLTNWDKTHIDVLSILRWARWFPETEFYFHIAGTVPEYPSLDVLTDIIRDALFALSGAVAKQRKVSEVLKTLNRLLHHKNVQWGQAVACSMVEEVSFSGGGLFIVVACRGFDTIKQFDMVDRDEFRFVTFEHSLFG